MFSQVESCPPQNSQTVANAIQFVPQRTKIYGVDKCVDTAIGFEFVREKLVVQNPRFCGLIPVQLCIGVEVVSEIALTSVQFVATSDPCFLDFEVDKKTAPDIEIQRNVAGNVTGIIVHFYNFESCCFENQMAFKLFGYDANGCKSIISHGLLAWR